MPECPSYLRMQELIAQDAPKRHKLSVHVVSSVGEVENHVVTDESPDGAAEPPKVCTVHVKICQGITAALAKCNFCLH